MTSNEWNKQHKQECRVARLKFWNKILDKYGISNSTISRYGLKLALSIYDKYNRKCSECMADRDLIIHHLDGKGWGYIKNGLLPNDDEDNLVLLCRKCHMSLHRKTNIKRVGESK